MANESVHAPAAPLVSIGIPTRGRPQGLARTLRDLCAQTWPNLEIIVSDNCTPGPQVDMLMRRLMREDPRIRYCRQPENLGIFGNFQFVLAQARGEFFMWAADDDEWEPTFVERCMALAGERGSVMCGFRTHLRATGELLDNPIPDLDPQRDCHGNVARFFATMQPSLFYGLHRRAEIGFVLEDRFFDFYDCYFVLRVLVEHGFRTFPEVLYRAGVDAPEREIKYADTGRRTLDYGTFLLRGVSTLLACRALGLRQKQDLLMRLRSVLEGLVRHHDPDVRPLGRLAADAWRSVTGPARRQPVRGATAAAGAAPDTDPAAGAITHAQAGEDAIVDFVFRAIRLERPTYLDIGAHHPQYLSNTYRLYRRGCRGVNVEPDPDLYAAFAPVRPHDVNLNVGIGIDGTGACLPFYVMSERTLNTFSAAEAQRYAATGSQRIEAVIEVPVLDINEVAAHHFDGAGPDFLSIDVEGLDFEIMQALDLERFRPVVICIETLTYSETREERKLTGIADYLLAHGYFVYADTYINTIFVDRARWRASA